MKYDLTRRPLTANKRFLRALYKAQLEQVTRWFEVQDSSQMVRQNMTLERYLRFASFSDISLQINNEKITYCATKTIKRGEDDVHCHLWIECPFDGNYSLVTDLYKKVYRRDLTRKD